MEKHDNYLGLVVAPRGRPEAIVAPRAGSRLFEVERIAPSAELAPYVDYHWLVRWTGARDHRQRVVPQPRVHVAAEAGRLLVHGVNRATFERLLTGTGHVLGTAFHPAGFRPLLGGPLAPLAGRVRPAAEVLGLDDRPTASAILGSADVEVEVVVGAMEAYLLGTAPVPDPTAEEVTALVLEAERRVEITRADQLAAHAGVSLRSLQRLFAEYVGVGPKWVVRRSRILDAAAAAHSGAPTDWARLAVELGFADQSHLIRAFTAVVGMPPATYERDPGTADPPGERAP